jgi:thioesterase domain-containing protein/acyl carrier protein
VPNGVVGELFIGGVGVARGYANDPVKTANAFFPDPFTDQWGGHMYRTGDLGRMLPDGNMEFIGRKDSQVKIRGHRVELGEIENVIRQNASVSKAIVLLSEDRNQLLAFIVPGKYYDRDTVIAFCKKKLPDYMVPAKWLEIDNLPLTTNGKTDTKTLLRIGSGKSTERNYMAPVTGLEKQLAGAWAEILQLEKVGVTDNFFDLGGQSLIAVELIHQMEKKTGKELPLNILYKCPTIAGLAAYMQQEPEKKKKWRSLVAMKPTGNKTPVYIVHGDGLSLSNFQNLSNYVDAEQPVFSLQPIGLNGVDEPLENLAEIASHYIAEIIEHNPDGPYMLGGYSFGGYVAIEMRRQLEAMGKIVKMTAIFDTNAENIAYTKGWAAALPKKIKRQVPKFLFIAQSIVTRPVTTIRYQYQLFSKRFDNLCYKVGIKQRPELKGIDLHINKINETHFRAFKKYQLSPFDDKVYLFKAQSRLYFVDDIKFLGWNNYARKGVEVYDVPGDHRTMFHPPYVSELARSLQHALDNC